MGSWGRPGPGRQRSSVAAGGVSGACRVESGQEQMEVPGHDNPSSPGEVGGGGGAEEQEARGTGSTQQDSWTPTSLSQLGSSSEPCSARQGVGQT